MSSSSQKALPTPSWKQRELNLTRFQHAACRPLVCAVRAICSKTSTSLRWFWVSPAMKSQLPGHCEQPSFHAAHHQTEIVDWCSYLYKLQWYKYIHWKAVPLKRDWRTPGRTSHCRLPLLLASLRGCFFSGTTQFNAHTSPADCKSKLSCTEKPPISGAAYEENTTSIQKSKTHQIVAFLQPKTNLSIPTHQPTKHRPRHHPARPVRRGAKRSPSIPGGARRSRSSPAAHGCFCLWRAWGVAKGEKIKWKGGPENGVG